MNIGVVIVAAGKSERMDGIDKLEIVYDSKTVLFHTISKFASHKDINEIVVVVTKEKKEYTTELVKVLESSKPIKIVEGGSSRLQSVRNGIAALDNNLEYCLIQDAARPFISDDLIRRTIEATIKYGAAVGGVTVTDTIKIVDENGFVSSTLDRNSLRAVGTPQGFKLKNFKTALETFSGETAYDDCEIIERMACLVKVIEGEEENIKITTRKDINRMIKEELRIGQGYDVHRIVKGENLILGGFQFPTNFSLEGHSDADVLLHAIIDSLLGAAALGDIGKHFPVGDEEYKGISSLVLLKKTAEKLEEAGYYIKNIDSTVICEEPKLSKYIEEIRRNISTALAIDMKDVSVKATTEEKLGFTGRGEGIAAQAVCLIARRVAIV